MTTVSPMHTTKDGTRIPIKDMGTDHLRRTIRVWERLASEGVTVRRGGGTTAEDIWYDEDRLFGDDALEHLNYRAYVDEYERRVAQ